MPQLMPLMWINSVLVSLIILVVLMEMYYYSMYNFDELNINEDLMNINFKW
uniref:ATP synthase F0 subunit 8 n=1 Tax=Carrhotus xanthogramma TaxID=1112393 RepID=A0A0H3W0W2_CARXA|nr:ATP synthase F0 subunit 8 [Carrhotus xanthogramma]AKH36468.1 ATP synthase F0 subunit 8 [Carrhotus xanthogramma]